MRKAYFVLVALLGLALPATSEAQARVSFQYGGAHQGMSEGLKAEFTDGVEGFVLIAETMGKRRLALEMERQEGLPEHHRQYPITRDAAETFHARMRFIHGEDEEEFIAERGEVTLITVSNNELTLRFNARARSNDGRELRVIGQVLAKRVVR